MALQSSSGPQHWSPAPHLSSSSDLHATGLLTIGPQLSVPFRYRQTSPLSQQVFPHSLSGGQPCSGPFCLHSLKKTFRFQHKIYLRKFYPKQPCIPQVTGLRSQYSPTWHSSVFLHNIPLGLWPFAPNIVKDRIKEIKIIFSNKSPFWTH